MAVKLTAEGVAEILQVIKEFPELLTDSILAGVHFKAAKPLVSKEIVLAPKGPTGNLRDSIGAYKVSKRRQTALGQVNVGPRRGGKYKGYHGHLVEFGTGPRKTGIMPAQPFAEPAFVATKSEVEKIISTELAHAMVRTMHKYLKR
jgi:HK97 gp10 family phage protein